MKYLKILLSLIVFIASKPLIQSQKCDANNFEFEFIWGIYEYYKVNSKENKVYVRIKHEGEYADTSIHFTKLDKRRLWNKLIKINFFDYPELYSSQPPQQDTVPEIFLIQGIDPQHPEPDTIYLEHKIKNYCINEITPHASYSLTVFINNSVKTVRWNNKTLIEFTGEKYIDIVDPKHIKLLELGKLIEEITKNKKGFKNLPQSDLLYY